MDRGEFFATSKMIIVAGKGGVGKTVVAAAIARAASAAGRSVLAVDIEGKQGLPWAFGRDELAYQAGPLLAAGTDDAGVEQAGVDGQTLPPDEALLDYLDDHGLQRLSGRLARTGMLDLVATATPGIKDLLVLGKIRALTEVSGHDLVVVDAPAAGHAITFLRAPEAVLDVVRVGPIRSQAERALELLGDPARCRVWLVTQAEETPVNELIETAFALEDDIGLHLGPAVVNGWLAETAADPVGVGSAELAAAAGVSVSAATLDALDAASGFRASRAGQGRAQMARLSAELPLTRFDLPFVFDAATGPDLSARLADHVGAAIDHLDAGSWT